MPENNKITRAEAIQLAKDSRKRIDGALKEEVAKDAAEEAIWKEDLWEDKCTLDSAYGDVQIDSGKKNLIGNIMVLLVCIENMIMILLSRIVGICL